MVIITGLSKAKVLAELYNNSRPLGLGHLHFDPTPMTEKEAFELLRTQVSFDYLKGRVMKVNLKDDDSFDPWLYDRDNGKGAAQRVIDQIKQLA